jgi:hypothetical protein
VKRLVRWSLWVALLASLPAGCNASDYNDDCNRLQTFSCTCFPNCQTEDTNVIDAQNGTDCTNQLKSAYNYWSSCVKSCAVNCQYGWGACAFGLYRQIGLAPQHECGADAGGG